MFGKMSRWALVALAVSAAIPLAAQGTVAMRLGTVVPENSPWVSALRSMSQKWMAETKRVRLTVLPPRQGESAIITDMGLGTLQAAALSSVGLARIDPNFNVLNMPFFFESDAELRHVLDKLTPHFKQQLEAKGYHLILWGHGGWVQVFSKNPIRSMADLQKAKLYTSEGDPKTQAWYVRNGFHTIPLPEGQIPTQLQLPTGQIDATPSITTFALLFFKDAKYMLDVRVAPLVAGVVVTKAAWEKLTPAEQQKMLEIAKATENDLFAQAPGLDARNIKEMSAAGLQVVTLDKKTLDEFRVKADAMVATQRGEMMSNEIYDWAVRERNAFRKSK